MAKKNRFKLKAVDMPVNELSPLPSHRENGLKNTFHSISV